LAGGKDPIASTVAEVFAAKGPESCAQAPATDGHLTRSHLRCCAMQPNLGARTSKAGSARGMERAGDPLTITDAYSRFLLCCQIAVKADTVHVEALFDAAFREYGLPEVIHTDNGAPFASKAPGGLSRLSMRWVRLGIVAERSRPASPQDNGRHERMHRTLKQDTLSPPARIRSGSKRRFGFGRSGITRPSARVAGVSNHRRAVYARSPREFPRRVPEVEYDSGVLVRRVMKKGQLYWKGKEVFVQ